MPQSEMFADGSATGQTSRERRRDSGIGRSGARTVEATASRVKDVADCLLSIAEFLEEAKPEEIRFLAGLLGEWRNWSGSLRRGNFLRGVAHAVLEGSARVRLADWPTDEQAMALEQRRPKRGNGAMRRAAAAQGRES